MQNARNEPDSFESTEESVRGDLRHRLGLYPFVPIAMGDTGMPVERLMALQSAFARFVHLLVSLRLPRLDFASSAWRRLHPQ